MLFTALSVWPRFWDKGLDQLTLLTVSCMVSQVLTAMGKNCLLLCRSHPGPHLAFHTETPTSKCLCMYISPSIALTLLLGVCGGCSQASLTCSARVCMHTHSHPPHTPGILFHFATHQHAALLFKSVVITRCLQGHGASQVPTMCKGGRGTQGCTDNWVPTSNVLAVLGQ